METHGGIQSFFHFLLWKVWNTLPNNEELQKLLNVAAQRLGTQPEQLKQQAENGTLQKMLNNLNANDAAKLQQVLSDKEAANKLLNSPQAQVLLKKFLGK